MARTAPHPPSGPAPGPACWGGADGALWHALPFPALVVGPGWRITAANPAAEAFLNLSQRQLFGQSLAELLALAAPLEEAVARLADGHEAYTASDITLGGPDRAPVTCDLQVTALPDRPDQVLVLFQAREFARKLGRRGGTAKAARSAIGMADMLAHEIKNPLAGISGAAQLLDMGLASADDRELAQLIVAETRRIVKLLEQVEQFGHMRPPEFRAVNIHDILDRARRSSELGLASHMRIVEEFDPSLPPVWADADQLTQVFLNLIRNAGEAAGNAGGQIRLRTFYDPGLRLRRGAQSQALPVQIEVTDDGPGIPPALADDLFEPFVSGRENGTGLGLALVSRIIDDHGGWIGVESRPGRTSFRIALAKAPLDEV